MKLRIADDKMRELRISLAKLLGEDWTHDPDAERDWEGSRIMRKDGGSIAVRAEQDRVAISGWSAEYADMSTYRREKTPMPEITVAIERGPLAIFRDMERRFLPAFDAAQTAAFAAKAEKLAFGQAHKNTFDRITAAFGDTLFRSSDGNELLKGTGSMGFLQAGVTDSILRAEVKIHSSDSIGFEISCGPNVAVKIAEFLTTILTEAPQKQTRYQIEGGLNLKGEA